MSAHLHTRPFNLDHAKAGAPFCCANGEQVEILKWDRKHTQMIVGVSEQDAAVRLWRADGSYGSTKDLERYSLVMTPLGFIDGKPVFVGDEFLEAAGLRCAAQPGFRGFIDCSWPAPEKQYPVTRMTGEELDKVYLRAKGGVEVRMVAVANAALRDAVDAGQVKELPFPGVMVAYDLSPMVHENAITKKVKELGWLDPEQAKQLRADLKRESMELGKAERLLESLGYRSAGNGEWTPPALTFKLFNTAPPTGSCRIVEGDYSLRPQAEVVRQDIPSTGLDTRAARDMAIAEAVRDAALSAFHDGPDAGPDALYEIRRIDLAAIIAEVQP